jgi:hypothetical protein
MILQRVNREAAERAFIVMQANDANVTAPGTAGQHLTWLHAYDSHGLCGGAFADHLDPGDDFRPDLVAAQVGDPFPNVWPSYAGYVSIVINSEQEGATKRIEEPNQFSCDSSPRLPLNGQTYQDTPGRNYLRARFV